jgi:hypothetical protein
MPYFVDTAFFLALVLQRDEFHSSAVRWQEIAEGGFVTTDYVLVETMNGLSGQSSRAVAHALVQQVRTAGEFEVIPASRRLMDAGMELFRTRLDKEWSLTDCISFVIMQERGLVDALTADHHFEQGGFRALLRT